MEFERQSVKWYWLAAFSIYAVIAIYLVLTSNPYLYSNKKFHMSLAGGKDDQPRPVPSPQKQTMNSQNLGTATYIERYNWGRTAVDPTGITRNKGFVEATNTSLFSKPLANTKVRLAHDDSGYYAANGNKSLLAVSAKGQTRWRFQFATKGLLRPALDKKLVYVTNKEGKIAALKKASGQLIWFLDINEKIRSAPFVFNDVLFVAVDGKLFSSSEQNGTTLIKIERSTGKILKHSELVEETGLFKVAVSPKSQALYLSAGQQLTAINLKTLKKQWTKSFATTLQGPPVVVNGTMFAATQKGFVYKISRKQGDVQWKEKLPSAITAPPTYIPLHKRLSVFTKSTKLYVLDTEDGQQLWNFRTRSEAPFKASWTLRLNGKMIKKLGMKWRYKGWVIMAPCLSKKICVFNPSNGKIVSRIYLKGGQLFDFPIFTKDDDFYLLTQDKKGILHHSHIMERATYLRQQKNQ